MIIKNISAKNIFYLNLLNIINI